MFIHSYGFEFEQLIFNRLEFFAIEPKNNNARHFFGGKGNNNKYANISRGKNSGNKTTNVIHIKLYTSVNDEGNFPD